MSFGAVIGMVCGGAAGRERAVNDLCETRVVDGKMYMLGAVSCSALLMTGS